MYIQIATKASIVFFGNVDILGDSNDLKCPALFLAI